MHVVSWLIYRAISKNVTTEGDLDSNFVIYLGKEIQISLFTLRIFGHVVLILILVMENCSIQKEMHILFMRYIYAYTTGYVFILYTQTQRKSNVVSLR